MSDLVSRWVGVACAILILVYALVRARRSYPSIRDLPVSARNSWLVPFIPLVAWGCTLLVGNLDLLHLELGWPSALDLLFQPAECLLGFSIPLAFIWMGWRAERERQNSSDPQTRARKGATRWYRLFHRNH